MEQVCPVRVQGPLAPYRGALAAELLARGYTPLSARNLIRVAAHLSRWLEQVRCSPSDLTAARIEEFLEHRRACGYTCWLTLRGLTPILESLRVLGAVAAIEPAAIDDSPATQLLGDFEIYLIEERGIQPTTAAGYIRQLKPFVESVELSNLQQLSADTVSQFILREARSSGIGYLKLKVTALRSFLRYLHVEGGCRDLRAAVPAVAGSRLSGLPKAISEAAVRRLEQSCDRHTPVGQRDYAILLLCSRLGLRAGEIAALSLEDVLWARGEILIGGKGSESVLPLPQEVGDAIVDYLRAGRRCSTSRRLFLQVRAPYREVTAGAVKAVVRNACRRARLPSVGSHCLRHTAATVMLRKGSSLAEIAQVLRHDSLMTTAIYAKVDDLALRPLARPWPRGAA